MKFITTSLAAVGAFGLLFSTSGQESDAIRRKLQNAPKLLSPKLTVDKPTVRKLKRPKGKPRSFTATMNIFGNNSVKGVSAVHYSGDKSTLLSLDITGLISNSGTAVITEGMSCEVNKVIETPLVCKGGTSSSIEIDGFQSMSRSAGRVNTGCAGKKILGKTVLIYDGIPESNSTIVGCGKLVPEQLNKKLNAKMSKYPSYSGDLNPEGKVFVEYNADNTFKFKFDISGVAPECKDCGIHIHAGISCESHDAVMAHGWNSFIVRDLWVTEGGAVYNSNKYGKASGFFSMYNGYSYEMNLNHAVVIHDQDGTRIGCGILMGPK